MVSKLWPVGQMRPYACLNPAFKALFLPLIQDTNPSTDTNDGALFLPLTPMVGYYIPPTNTNDGQLFLLFLTKGAMPEALFTLIDAEAFSTLTGESLPPIKFEG